MTSMKKNKYYRYYDKQRNQYNVVKINGIKYLPNGSIYGTSIRYKIYTKPISGSIGLIYTNRYFWNKESKEITKEQALVESL